MKYKLIIQPPALVDLEEAYCWIAERAPENAARWFNRFIEALHTLEDYPTHCGLAPESEQIGREVRQLLYGRRGGVYRALTPLWSSWRSLSSIVRHSRQGSTRSSYSPCRQEHDDSGGVLKKPLQDCIL